MNLPATLKEYCLEVDIDYDEDRDKQNEELYKDMVGYLRLVSQFENKILSGEIKTHSLKEFKQKQEQKRKELQRRQGTSDE